jgi:hypothetical protein
MNLQSGFTFANRSINSRNKTKHKDTESTSSYQYGRLRNLQAGPTQRPNIHSRNQYKKKGARKQYPKGIVSKLSLNHLAQSIHPRTYKIQPKH